MTEQKPTRTEQELYFLIAKFLKNGPCHRAAQVLSEELAEHQILQKRVHWTGREDEQSFDDLAGSLTHISDNHLLQVLQHYVPLIDQTFPPSVPGITTLLGAGRQSLLRSENSLVNRLVRTSLELATHRNVNIRINSSLSSNIAHVMSSRSLCGFTNRHNIAHDAFYSKLKLHRRVLGHLAPVYCLLLDRTGTRIFTGADDNLVKIWSLTDGCLLLTLRGHQSEIADISLNSENTLLATGGLDKTVRVWDVKTGAPIAVLHGHTGGITSVEFSPTPYLEAKCLISTGKDGSLCIWQWDPESNEFGSQPLKFNERQRVGDQVLCSAFSPGGSFLVTGGTDHTVRVYRVNPPPSHQIAELHGHTDQVLSICFSQRRNRFLTGSDDGTAHVWQYLSGQWRSNVLSMLSRKTNDQDDLFMSRVNKLKVTMISWSCNDRFIITAANDTAVRIWDSTDFSLLHMLRGHKKDVYVLETHAVDERILMTAGHDSRIILWNIETGAKLKEFENKYDPDVGVSGGAALLEGKSSSDGLTYILTDSQGSVSIYGFGSSAEYLKVPDHQFFHTDFRPLIRDANGYVLDEQTQLAPHLMPPPYLVNADGNPYPPEYQQIVCACKRKERPDHCAHETEDAMSTRDHVEGANRLDAVIARLQRERQGFITNTGVNDSSDSGVGSSQVEEPVLVQPQQTATSDIFHSGQQILQSAHVGFGQRSLMHTQMTDSFSNSQLPGPLMQPQLSGVGLYTQNALYGSGMVGGGLHQSYSSVPIPMNWPLVGAPFTQPGNLMNSGQHSVLAGGSFMATELPFSENSGLERFVYGSLPRPAPSNLTHLAQPHSAGMNLYDGIPQPLVYPAIVTAGPQTASSSSRLRPIAPKSEPLISSNHGTVASLATVGSIAESGPSGIGAMPLANQPSQVSSMETHSRHANSNLNHQNSQAGGIHENGENIDVETVDESHNNQEPNRTNEPLTGSVASFLGIDHKEALMWWRSRVIVPDIPPPLARHQELRQCFLAEEELRLFTEESSKLPPQAAAEEEPPQPVQPVDSPRTQRRRRRNVLQQQLAEAAANALSSNRRRNRVVSMRSDEEFATVSSSSSAEEFEEEWHMSSESSEYSDWIGEGVSVQPRVSISRSQRPSRYRRRVVQAVVSDEEEPEAEPREEAVESAQRPEVTVSEAEAEASASAVDTSREENSNARARQQRRVVAQVRQEPPWPPVGVDMSAYLPSPWLLQTEPTLNPFFPQLGDKVVYCWQGHEQYINAVILNDVYKIKTKHFPWQRLRLRPQEVCMVLSMHFVVGPPTLCSMKLGILVKGQSGTSVHRTFSLRYHDMADVPDFLIPYDHFKRAVLRPWTPGDRFQCKIDDAWWTGSIIAREQWQLSVPDSLWQCFLVQWDTGEEQEKLSPWDVEVTPSDDGAKPRRRGSSLSEDLALAFQLSSAPGVQTRRQAAMSGPSGASDEQQLLSDLLEILSEDFDHDKDAWGEEGEAVARDRILRGLDAILSLPIAQPFQQPVNVEEYPDYYLAIPYPIDLGTIRQRLNNGYYRRLNSFLWDVKTIHRNATTYNEEDSQIVESAETLTELFCKFASDSNCPELMVLYSEQNRQNVPEEGEEYQAESAESSDSATEIEIEGDQESAKPVREVLRASSTGPPNSSGESGSRSKGKRRRLSSEVSSESQPLQVKRAKTWVPLAVDLVHEMISLPFSEPFRVPVDLDLYPDYVAYVDHPMDLSTVRRKLQDEQYYTPTQFCEDVRLIFSNSRLYNRAPKSQIVRLTNKLSMHFESRVIAFLSNCGIDHPEVSGMIQATRSPATRTQRTSSNDYEGTSESSTSNLDTSESSSSVEESDVEETPRARRRNEKEHAVNGRTSKRATNRAPSSEESDYGAGAETSSGECTGSDDDFNKRTRRQRSSRGNQRCKRVFRNRKGSSEDQVAVSRPRRQMAGRRLPSSQDWDTFGSYSSRPPRQAAMRALENVALLDLGAEAWAESRRPCSTRARSRRLSSVEGEDGFHGGAGQQASCSITRHGRIVRPSTRTRAYDDV